MCVGSFTKNVFASYSGCTFEGYHYGYGGVFNAKYSISSEEQNDLKLELNDCIFKNNAGKYGGCMYLLGYDNNIRLNAKHCTFEENFATTGGAVWAENATVNFTDCIFKKNTPMKTEEEISNGGALFLKNCNAELNGCLFSENSSLKSGAGIYGELYPFKPFIIENCTFIGNSSLTDENIFVCLKKTNYSTLPKIRLYFSSVFGECGYSKEDTESFGCVYVSSNSQEEIPSGQNGYNLYLSTEKVQQIASLNCYNHFVLPSGKYEIPKEETDKIANGKFKNSFGKLKVGDNYVSEITLTVERSSKNKETVVLRYGDELLLDAPVRNGYSFDGWDNLNGTVFMGGELLEETVVAKWNFQLKKHSYIIWLPILVIGVGFAVWVVIKKRRKTAVQTEVSACEVVNNNSIVKVWFTEDEISYIVSSTTEIQTLTKREKEVFTEILQGKKQKEISYDLGIEITTVKDFYRKIYDKFSVKNREELLKYCSNIVSK